MARLREMGPRRKTAVALLTSPRSLLVSGPRVHATAVVGDGVRLGDDAVVGPYSVLIGPLDVGARAWIGPFVSLGAPSEVRDGPHPVGWDGEAAGGGVVIGAGCVLREFVTVNQGFERPTRLGADCYLMSGSHIGHDSVLGDGVTVTSAVQVAGHCDIWPWVNLGLGVVVHQRAAVGPGAMVGMGSVVRRDVEAFTVSLGDPARATGMNEVGLSRRGCTEEMVKGLQRFLVGREDLPAGLPDEVREQAVAWAGRSGTTTH